MSPEQALTFCNLASLPVCGWNVISASWMTCLPCYDGLYSMWNFSSVKNFSPITIVRTWYHNKHQQTNNTWNTIYQIIQILNHRKNLKYSTHPHTYQQFHLLTYCVFPCAMRNMCMCIRVNMYLQKWICISACACDNLSQHRKFSFSIFHPIHWGKVSQLISELPHMTTSQASQKFSDPLSHLLEYYKCKWATTPQAGFCMSHWDLNSELQNCLTYVYITETFLLP